jgi:predicted ester cyclase
MADVREVVRAVIDEFNAHDLDALGTYHAENVVLEAPGDVHLQGIEPAVEYARGWLRAFPDAKLTPHNEVYAGEWGAVEFTFEGTHTDTLVGPAGEIPATNRRVSGRGSEFFRVVDGKVVEDHLYFDMVQVMSQLGLMPEPATA